MGVDLAATKSNLSDTKEALAKEQNAHQSSRKALEAEVVRLTEDLNQSQDTGSDLGEQLAATKQELGQRVAEVTQLSAQLAHAQDTKGHLEERIQSLTDEAQRREELLQNDLASKSKELADTLRKLTALSQEKTRQVDALTRDATAKGEAAKTLEAKLKTLFDESKRKTDELNNRLTGATHELQAAKAEIGEKAELLARLQQTKDGGDKQHANEKQQLQAQVQQLNARLGEAAKALEAERADKKKHVDEQTGKAQRAEARIAQVQQESQQKLLEIENRHKELSAQLNMRTKRVTELEQALEGASATKARAEKELQARLAAAEQKANEAAAKLQVAIRERKDLEAKHLKDVEDIGVKHKGEIDRREQVKAQEVQRLQSAVQEKSKQLKVVELELQRYKSKPGAAPGAAAPAARPAATGTGVNKAVEAKSSLAQAIGSAIGEDDDSTKMNTVPVDVRAASPAPATSKSGVNPAVAKTAMSPAAKPGAAKSPVPGMSAAPAQKSQEREDRTVVMPAGSASPLPPKRGDEDDDADFNSLIDNLGD